MQSLTNKDTAKVFALYLGCDTNIEPPYNKVTGSMVDLSEKGVINKNLKIALTPLENISDEDAIEMAKLATNRKLPHYTIDDFSIEKRENAIEVIFLDNLDEIINIGYDCNVLVYKNEKNKNSIYHRPLNQSQYFLYLISRGYSVPLYFGIDHPCNGRTPIELNIAIAK